MKALGEYRSFVREMQETFESKDKTAVPVPEGSMQVEVRGDDINSALRILKKSLGLNGESTWRSREG